MVTEPQGWTPLFYNVCSPSFKTGGNNPRDRENGVEGGKGGCMTFLNEMDKN